MVKLVQSGLAILLAAGLAGVRPAPRAAAQGIYFDDSDPDLMRLGNGYWEVGLRKSNGGIAYISDKTTGQDVSMGSRYECLWGAVFPGDPVDYTGGCHYHRDWANHFGYTWTGSSHVLTLNYTPDPDFEQKVTAQATIVASEFEWFDMRLDLTNEWGSRLNYALYPSDLLFLEADIEEALLPILPGVVLEPAFFQEHRTFTANYPGYPGTFADYVSVASTKGHVAIYSLHDGGPIHPLVVGFIHDDEYVPGGTYYYHTFAAGVSDGGSWQSPCVRARVSQAAPVTIAAFRTENGLDLVPSLDQKLGAKYDQLVRSPLYKIDAEQVAIPFSEYGELLAEVPAPALLHPVAFQPRGHDENYPDFLPPDPEWGTTADFAAMFQEAQAEDFLVMPYINPTWWDDESPTLQNLPPPLTIEDIAVLDENGTPVYEYYGTRGGYVMSPYASFVEQRVAQLLGEMTGDVPSDLVFEDQIGARSLFFDYNASSPFPTAYHDGWWEHTQAYGDVLLMTELGFDRLVETEVGFHGSLLLPERLGYTPNWWGTGTWHPYPLAPLMARDKVLFYQHDLAPETFTIDKQTLTWNLALGYLLSYDLGYGGGLESPWMQLVSDFHVQVLSRYAGERMTGYAPLADEVTQTTFETYAVIANWDDANAYDAGLHTLSPEGVMVGSGNGTVTGGVFCAYNNAPLSAGDHYLIEERENDAIVVRQPLGADTALTLELLPYWPPGESVMVRAYTRHGELIDAVPVTVAGTALTFTYQQELDGQPVGYYMVVEPVPAQASFTAEPLGGLIPLSVSFTNQSSGDYDICAWDFGDGGTSDDCSDPSHIYSAAGIYDVALTVSGSGGSDTLTRIDYIIAYEPVEAGFFGSPTDGVAPLVVSFTNQSTGTFDTCSWGFGDGDTSSSCGNPTHAYVVPGVYTVSLTVSGPGGTDTLTRVDYISVHEPVVADFAGIPTIGVAPLLVSFTNQSTGDYDTCAWDFGDGGTSTSCNDPVHTYTGAGAYTVALTVSGLGGIDVLARADYIQVAEPHRLYLPLVMRQFAGGDLGSPHKTPPAGHGGVQRRR